MQHSNNFFRSILDLEPATPLLSTINDEILVVDLKNDSEKKLVKFVQLSIFGEFLKSESVPSIGKLLINFQAFQKFASNASSDSVFYADHENIIKKNVSKLRKEILKDIIQII